MSPDVRECVLMVCPFLVSFFPGRDVLTDEIWAEFFGFDDVYVPAQTGFAGGIVYGYETLPNGSLVSCGSGGGSLDRSSDRSKKHTIVEQQAVDPLVRPI